MLAVAVLVVTVEELAVPPDPSVLEPVPDVAVLDCTAADARIAPPGGWDAVKALVTDSGPLRAIRAVVSDTAQGPALLVRVETDGANSGGSSVFVDTDADRLRGVWSYETPVSAAAWDLHVDVDGQVWHHTGLPDQWTWEPRVAPEGFAYERQPTATTMCLPAELVGDGLSEVRLAAMIDDAWLPATFLGGVSVADSRPAIAVAADGGRQRLVVDPLLTRQRIHAPKHLAFAYQFTPWAVRGCPRDTDDLSCALDAYEPFTHIVFGGGIEEPSHSSHATTAQLVAELKRADPAREIWGYVSLRRHAGQWHDVAEVLRRAALWRDMGVTGIFLDEFDLCEPGWRTCPQTSDGDELVFTRERQRDAVRGIHAEGLAVFANAHSIHGALGDVRGEPTPLGQAAAGRPDDMYLLENPTIHAGRWWTGLDRLAGAARIREAAEYAAATGVRLAVVDTSATAVADDDVADTGYQASWWRAVMASAHAHAFTNPLYSASGEFRDNLPAVGVPPGGEIFTERWLAFVGGVTLERDGMVAARSITDASGTTVGRLEITTGDDGAVTARLELDGHPSR